MKRFLTIISLLLVLLMAFASCDKISMKPSEPETESSNESTRPIEGEQDVITLTYMKAQNLGYAGTLEEFLALVKGQDGRGIIDVTLFEGNLVLYFSDKTTINLGKIGGEKGEDGKDGETPFIGENGNWWIGTTDTGIKAQGPQGEQGEKGETGAQGPQGEKGEAGDTPYIGSNGNWWIGNTDTGVKAEAVGIKSIAVNANGELIVTMTDGSESNLGKVNVSSVGLPEIEISKVGISDEGKLIVTLKQGIRFACEKFDPIVNGKLAINISIKSDGSVVAFLIDGSTYNLGKVASTSITKDLNVTVKFENGTERSLGTISTVMMAPCNHLYSDWVDGEKATCSSMGFNSRVCANCGDLDYDFIPALGHTWDGNVFMIKAPTAKADGNILVSCSVCGCAKLEIFKATGDYDNDGLTNGDEIAKFGTDPLNADTDGDGLNDYEEIFTYMTNANKEDTDGDGATDYAEVKYGTDPNVAEVSFNVDVVLEGDPEDTVNPGVAVQGITSAQLNTLEVNSIDFFEEDTAGYMGKAYEYKIEGTVTSAEISFEFGTPATTYSLRAAATPDYTIYRFDPNENSLYPQQTTINGNVATAVVDQFGTYILLNRSVYPEEDKWIDVWGSGTNYTDMEVVFVIDDSGSLGGDYGYNSSTGFFNGGNDPKHKRLEVVRDMLSKFGDNVKASIVKFDSSSGYRNLSNGFVTCDATGISTLQKLMKISSSQNTNGFDSKGTTYMYSAIDEAMGIYESTNPQTLKIMIVLSDGEAFDSEKHDATIKSANDKGIKIWTVGLGSSSSSYFTQYLKPLAEQTGGKYVYSENAEMLEEIYELIKKGIDINLDTDGDGICDYYEENMVSMDGVTPMITDKNNRDTDGDGLWDGDEVTLVKMYNDDKTKIRFTGKIHTNPKDDDTDDDGLLDGEERIIISRNPDGNNREIMYSDPTKADTDDDGVNDLNDNYPTDGTRA